MVLSRARLLLSPILATYLFYHIFTFFLQNTGSSVSQKDHWAGQTSQYFAPRLVDTLREPIKVTAGHQGYTCGPDSPYSNGACCGSNGWCGYSSTYCSDRCTSNCNATASCGKDASNPGQTYPLNVCCSQYRFYGSTSKFCDSNCQSFCTQPKPSPARSNIQKRVIGYWEGWNSQHPCGSMPVGQIPATMLTHLNITFTYLDSTFQVIPIPGIDSSVYQNIGNIKTQNPNIKLSIFIDS